MTPGSDPWLFGVCASRIGAYMIYIAYAAALPVLQREWQMSATAAGGIASSFQLAYAISLMGCSEIAAILDWHGARTAEAWGWAFVSLGIAGAMAVASVLMLYRTPEARVLQRAAGRP